MKPEYVSSEIKKRPWFTSDDFLITFRSPHENVMRFQNIFIRPSKIFQKIIRSEREVRLISVNNIFRFHIILMVIYGPKFIFVPYTRNKWKLEFIKFFSLQREKWLDFRASFSALFSECFQDLGIEEHLLPQESKIHM